MKINLKELQKIELGILTEFDLFCRAHDLKYSIAAGTMIGAVRHKGFIPWDDDIDIFMMRNEYMRFIALIKEGSSFSKEYIQTILPDDNNSFYPFLKVIDTRTILYEKNVSRENTIGAWIDIFPVDYIGNDKEKAIDKCKHFKKIAKQYMLYYMKFEDVGFKSIAKNVCVKLMNKLMRQRKNDIFDELTSYAGLVSSKYCGTIIWAKTTRDIYESYFFEEYTELEFEGKHFMAFSHYHEILTSRYGDYLKLPPESDRFSHNPEAYWIGGDFK